MELSDDVLYYFINILSYEDFINFSKLNIFQQGTIEHIELNECLELHKMCRLLGLDNALSTAIDKNNYRMITFFIENYDITNMGRHLYNASNRSDKNILNFLINKSDYNHLNFSMALCVLDGNNKMVEYFVDKGADHFNWGMAYAAKAGKFDLIEYFISNGARHFDWALACVTDNNKELINFLKIKKNIYGQSRIIANSEVRQYFN